MLRADAGNLIIDDAGLAAMASGVGGDPGPSDLPPDGDVVPWTGEGDPPEIIVVAQRLENPPSPHAGEFLFWLNYSEMVDWGMVGIPGVVTPTGNFGSPPEVGIADDVDPANLAQVQAQQAVMMAEVLRLTAKIDQYGDFEAIHLPDGSTILALDLKELWSEINFVVTDKTFDPGKGGEFNRETMTSTFNFTTVSGWDASDGPEGNGLAFVLLHEVVHASSAGAGVEHTQWMSYKDDNPGKDEDWLSANYFDSIQFEENEEFANVGALKISNELGMDFSDNFAPTNGYEYDVADDDPDPVPGS